MRNIAFYFMHRFAHSAQAATFARTACALGIEVHSYRRILTTGARKLGKRRNEVAKCNREKLGAVLSRGIILFSSVWKFSSRSSGDWPTRTSGAARASGSSRSNRTARTTGTSVSVPASVRLGCCKQWWPKHNSWYKLQYGSGRSAKWWTYVCYCHDLQSIAK
jgi:hypothetical protein